MRTTCSWLKCGWFQLLPTKYVITTLHVNLPIRSCCEIQGTAMVLLPRVAGFSSPRYFQMTRWGSLASAAAIILAMSISMICSRVLTEKTTTPCSPDPWIKSSKTLIDRQKGTHQETNEQTVGCLTMEIKVGKSD